MTFSALVSKLHAATKITAINIIGIINKKLGPTSALYQIINIKNTNIAIRKSRSAASTEAKGRASLGKYAFETKLALLTTANEPRERLVAKNVQGRSAL